MTYRNFKQQHNCPHKLKCIVAKFSNRANGLISLDKALRKSELTEAMFLIKEKASFHHLDTAKWMTMEDFNALMPDRLIDEDEIKEGVVVHKNVRDGEFYVKILKKYNQNQVPPYDYIQDKITKVILSERKIQLLKKVRQNLYEKGKNDDKFEIYKYDQ